MGETTFIRTKKEKNYTVIDNTFLRDNTLSMQAKGVFAYILFLPEDWVIYQSELVKHFSNGRDAVNKAVKELEEHGYIRKTVKKDAKGRFAGVDYEVIENPVTEKSDSGNPVTENPYTENPKSEIPTLPNTNINQILINQNSIPSEEQEEVFKEMESLRNKPEVKETKKSFKKSDYLECVSLISSVQNTLKDKGFNIDTTQYPIPVMNKWLKKWFNVYGVEEVKKGIQNSMSNQWLVSETHYSLSALFSDTTFPKCVSNFTSSSLQIQKGKTAFVDRERTYDASKDGRWR